MAAVPRPLIHQDGDHPMTKAQKSLPSVTNRVMLHRVSADIAKVYPAGGENKVWWTKLKQALGTQSSDFVNASLIQLQAANRLPCRGISETALTAALAMIEAAAQQHLVGEALNLPEFPDPETAAAGGTGPVEGHPRSDRHGQLPGRSSSDHGHRSSRRRCGDWARADQRRRREDRG
jgi:hypothetical protein